MVKEVCISDEPWGRYEYQRRDMDIWEILSGIIKQPQQDIYNQHVIHTVNPHYYQQNVSFGQFLYPPNAGNYSAAKGCSSESGSSEDEEEGEDGEEQRSGDDITQLAQQLDGGAAEHDISISEQLQVINQEDLAAILPDVGAGGASFDGFEDVTAEASKSSAPQPASIATSSSESDTELQEQIVSEVISRIQVDSDTKEGFNSGRSPSTQEDSDREEANGCYSSNLLADFVEKTELLSRVSGDARSSEKNDKKSEPTKRRRGRPPKKHNAMPELEAYMRLDCSESNVSPDSGIQSVAGSPVGHQSIPSPSSVHNQGPPMLRALSPQPTQRSKSSKIKPEDKTKMHTAKGELRLENGGKRGPGRPKSFASTLKRFGQKKKGSKLKKNVPLAKKIELPPSATELKVPPFFAGSILEPNTIASLPCLSTYKKNRGRPKKSPPVLEPNLPLEDIRLEESDSSKKLNDAASLSGSVTSNKIEPLIFPLPKIRNKHKHKKRKKLEFKILEPEFLSEIEKLADELKQKCYISPIKSKCSKKIDKKVTKKIKSKKLRSSSRTKKGKTEKTKIEIIKNNNNAEEIKELITPPEVTEVKETESSNQTENKCESTQSVEKSDLEIVPEISKQEKCKEDDTKEKIKEKPSKMVSMVSPSHTSHTNIRRRVKKSVEPSKGHNPESANNEQRLPLKKRHYHISSTADNLSIDSEKSDSSLDSNEDKSYSKSESDKTETEQSDTVIVSPKKHIEEDDKKTKDKRKISQKRVSARQAAAKQEQVAKEAKDAKEAKETKDKIVKRSQRVEAKDQVKEVKETTVQEEISSKLLRTRSDKKPPPGVFEPSPQAEAELKLLSATTGKVSDVLTKMKNKLLPDVEINMDEEMRRLKHADKELKKPDFLCNLRVQVQKLTEADILLQKIGSKPKCKRKKINRTGFPTKKKKKKKLDILDDLKNSTSPPLLEDQTKLSIKIPTDSSTPALSPIIKIEDKVSDSETENKIEVRPASKRIMELKAKKDKKRKRKSIEEKKEDNEDDVDVVQETKIKKSKDDQDDSDADSVKMKKKPKWKKKYLNAGLFSTHFKENEARKSHCEKKTKVDEETDLIPAPAYFDKWVRQRKVSFQFPHDLWWLHAHTQLPGREEVPSWNYKKIRTNVYYDVKPIVTIEAQACNCKPTSLPGCGEDCINRMVYVECSPQLCPCKEKCSNQKIQRHEWAPGLSKFMTRDKGWGIKTKQLIKKDIFILEYVGEVVSDKEFKSRMATKYTKDTHHYCLNLDGGLLIDGHRMGGEGRFVNHSCEPNCEMQKWCVNGLFRMALFALREIQPNEELTYDYNFSLFNPAEGQPCKCGSNNCRGVIGGKSQRVGGAGNNGAVSAVENSEKIQNINRRRKNMVNNRRKTKKVDKFAKGNTQKAKEGKYMSMATARYNQIVQTKPFTSQQKNFILTHKPLLIRNVLKVMGKDKNIEKNDTTIFVKENKEQPNGNSQDFFKTQMNAISCPRSMKTRTLAQFEENPEMTKNIKLACIFKELFNQIMNAKDENNDLLCASFITLPPKKKFPQYYQRIQNPIDLMTIEHNINTGFYKNVAAFDDDIMNLFKNNVRWFGRTTELGIAATRLRKIYNLSKLNMVEKLQELLGEPLPNSFIPPEDPSKEDEDVIRCICGIYMDEGLMIQCERCMVWQHCYCVKANSSVESYMCERCVPRNVDYEIESQEKSESPDRVNYTTLLRGDMLLKQGDTVYVLRDIINEDSTSNPKDKHTYKSIKDWNYTDCDIFKIENLWKDKNGDRFAFGHHYLRPHETFHEPTRKFFPNELMRVPLYEVVPVELVMGHCFVLDLNTYCKGRPIGSNSEHIYVCEYRVDKYARMFAKISKPKHSNVCTKSYAFETYDVRLKPLRTYAPHGMANDTNIARGRGGRNAHIDEPIPVLPPKRRKRPQQTSDEKIKQQKSRLNELLLKLLNKAPSKLALDVSYLLEKTGRRQRKKPHLLVS